MKGVVPPDLEPPPPALWAAAQQHLRQQQQGETIQRRAAWETAPLSFAQERLWFICQSRPNTAAYNIPFAWRLFGDLSEPALRSALRALSQRHDILRTRFSQNHGAPFQQVAAEAELNLLFEDMSTLPSSRRIPSAMECARGLAAQPFTLDQPPLFRAALIKLGPQDHLLLLVFHHLIFDGWSRDVFLRDLRSFYVAALTGTPAQLRNVDISYGDFAFWERRQTINEEHLNEWKEELASPLPQLDLPLDRPRPPVSALLGNALPLRLAPRVWSGMEQLRAEEQTTRFVVLISAFAAVLHRWTAQNDFVIGTAIANRYRPETRNAVGFFVNTVPLRIQPNAAMTFRELMRHAQQVMARAFERGSIPFHKIVEATNPERSLSASPLLNALFVLQTASRADLVLPGLRSHSIRIHNGTAKFDLTFELSESARGIAGSIEYNGEVFEGESMRWFGRHYQALLGAAAASPSSPISHLPLLTSRERKLVANWNGTDTAFPANDTLPGLFAVVARENPNATAVAFGDRAWSYTELNTAADRVATALALRHIGRGDRVGICMERSGNMVIAMLAILKAGATYVPLDPSYPQQRLAFMLSDSAASVVLVDARTSSHASLSGATLLHIEDAKSCATRAFTPPRESAADDIAYVLYTSGSTGVPKGVCVPHRAIARLVRNTNYVNIRPSDTVAQGSNASFDAATFEIWGALLNGARLAILPRDVMLDPTSLADELKRHRVSVLFLTTALFNVIARDHPNALASVETILFGGEAADPRTVRTAIEALPRARLINGYGPTETTTFATWQDMRRCSLARPTVPIGKPIANTDVHILSSDGRLTPICARGEIYIGGPGLAAGYLDRPELTAEHFVTREVLMPSGPVSRRLYRTGDFGRRLPDGSIEFLGRADKQVKIRGFRVELSEIEAAMTSHPLVSSAAVILDDTHQERQLAGFVAVQEGAEVTAHDLKEWLRGKLPEYMVPSVALVDAIPLNPNGKVDRAKLLLDATPSSAVVDLKPWIPLQVQLSQIWCELLGRPTVGIRDSFFDLGGHSLLALRMIDRIEQVCGAKIPVAALFTANTIEQLSEVILRQQFSASKPLIEIQPHGTRTPIFFLHGDLLGGGVYCLNFARALGADQPFFAVPPAKMEDGSIATISDMAAEHLRVIRAHTPHGPYILGGFCIAGIIALEMARSLADSGESVPLLILADPPPPALLRGARALIRAHGQWKRRSIEQQLKSLMRFHNGIYRVRELRSGGAKAGIRVLCRRLLRAKAPAMSPERHGIDDGQLFAAYLWSAAAHRPAPYLGRAALFSCDHVMASAAQKRAAWKPVLPNAAMHHVSGEHLDLVTANVTELAIKLKRLLDS